MRKYTQEEVEKVFAQHGYTVQEKYQDARTPIKYECANGHIHATSQDNFKRGKRCLVCSYENASERYRHPYTYVKEYFRSHGCRLLSREYRNGGIPLAYRCSCGNVSTIRFNDFKTGKRCNKCATVKRVQSMQSAGRVLSSTQQRHIHKLIGGELNYPIAMASQDIAFPDKKIYVEYDGSGHNLAVKKGAMTQAKFDHREQKRTYALYHRGWKCIRIISRKDYLPMDDMLIDIINDAIDTLDGGRSYVTIDIDQRTITHSKLTVDADFGELYRLRTS